MENGERVNRGPLQIQQEITDEAVSRERARWEKVVAGLVEALEGCAEQLELLVSCYELEDETNAHFAMRARAVSRRARELLARGGR